MDFSTIDIDKVASSLKNATVGRIVEFHPSVPTTMALAHQAAEQHPIPSGLVILTDLQTKGRGRMQRGWITPPGRAILLSILLGPELLPQPLHHLPILSAVAVRRAIVNAHPNLTSQIRLKWPNDVLGGPDNGKVAGILIDGSFQTEDRMYCIIGIGINVNQLRHEFPDVPTRAPKPTSLRLLHDTGSGQPDLIDRTDLVISVCQSISVLLNASIANTDLATKAIWEEWRTHLHTIGQSVSVRQIAADEHKREIGTESFDGVAVGVTEDGYLIVENAQGNRRTFSSGEATLRSD